MSHNLLLGVLSPNQIKTSHLNTFCATSDLGTDTGRDKSLVKARQKDKSHKRQVR